MPSIFMLNFFEQATVCSLLLSEAQSQVNSGNCANANYLLLCIRTYPKRAEDTRTQGCLSCKSGIKIMRAKTYHGNRMGKLNFCRRMLRTCWVSSTTIKPYSIAKLLFAFYKILERFLDFGLAVACCRNNGKVSLGSFTNFNYFVQEHKYQISL